MSNPSLQVSKSDDLSLKNRLFYGDNLTVMKEYIPDNSIDLIYLDPPFNSNRTYNKIYRDMTGREVPEQVEAFCDTWEMDAEKMELMKTMTVTMRYYEMDEDFITFFDTWIKALRNSNSKLLAYLLYMTIRLLEMRKKLKDTGSIYLHCDPTASHYIKIMMDGIFGHDNFRNEISWKRATMSGGKAISKQYGRNKDSILFFSKGRKYYFNRQYVSYSEEYIKNKFIYTDEKGIYRLQPRGTRNASMEKLYEQNRVVVSKKTGYESIKYYLNDLKGVALDDIWTDIDPMTGKEQEAYLGYPTQKPISLLDRIIKASCPPNGVILDPFCGCGTSLYSAALNNRKWIGIDIATLSINLVKQTLEKRYNLEEKKDYELSGYPLTEEQAEMLFRKDPFQFQNWAIEDVGGFCSSKKTRDGGIDGAIYFRVFDKEAEQKMTLSVKGGKLKAVDVRDIMRVIERENSMMGGLICFDEPSKDMKKEMATMGMINLNGVNFEKMQYLTIRDILERKRLFHVPNMVAHKDTKKSHQTKLPI